MSIADKHMLIKDFELRIGEILTVTQTKVTVYHLRSYIKDYMSTGITDRTAENVREVLSAFFGWLYNEHLIEANPCANLGAIKCEKVVKLPYSDVDLEKLKESCKTDRDKAIIMFLMSTGCRINEMCSLNRDAINFVEGECIVHGKGNKERTVYLDNVALLHLKRYLDSRTDDIPALFIGQRKERLLPNGVRHMLREVQKHCGVEKVHPHKFRRTLATNLINRGMPIQDVAAILGHTKLDTTMRYVYIDRRSLKNAYQKFA